MKFSKFDIIIISGESTRIIGRHTVIRYKFDKKACLSPQLHQVGWSIFTEPVHDNENLPSHVHEAEYEICYIVHGGVDWQVEEELFEVKPGYLFLTFPHEEHGGLHDIMNPCELYWAQVELPKDKAMKGLSQKESSLLIEEFGQIGQRSFPALPEVPTYFKHIIDEHRMASKYGSIVVRSALVELLVSVLRSYQAYRGHDRTDQEYSKAIRIACELMDSNLSNEPKIEEIVKHAGLSNTVFYRSFYEEVHLTPGEYVTQQRMTRAKELLRQSDLSITEIAYQLGYSSSQYFATIFKKRSGITPRQYRLQES